MDVEFNTGYWIGFALGLLAAIVLAVLITMTLGLSFPWNAILGFVFGFIIPKYTRRAGSQAWIDKEAGK